MTCGRVPCPTPTLTSACYRRRSAAPAPLTLIAVGEDVGGEPLRRGTRITLHLKPDALEFADAARLGGLVKQYSEFIAFPIKLWSTTSKPLQVCVPVLVCCAVCVRVRGGRCGCAGGSVWGALGDAGGCWGVQGEVWGVGSVSAALISFADLPHPQVVDEEATAKAQAEADAKAAAEGEEGKAADAVAPGGGRASCLLLLLLLTGRQLGSQTRSSKGSCESPPTAATNCTVPHRCTALYFSVPLYCRTAPQ